ncbi:ABC transporter ATP-binding protein [Frankia tisae]|uniref:ABC transporter ATP-binding protein n=1 Tax=Frankia tisae TaxID=2950104 RepID=UPI0021C1CDE5|nr:ABC transporter ATP-binding protein [Frankia tisae]
MATRLHRELADRTAGPDSLALQVRGLGRAFDGRSVLRGVDLDVRPGEFVALLGASGSGKTTLLRILGGLDIGFSGTIRVPTARSVVFQEPRLLPWKRVWKNVAFGLRDSDARAKARAALDEVGLRQHADVFPATLSGGESQRVALARALVRAPDLLLLDEPFASLDALTRIRMHALVAELWARHDPAVVLVTHDVDEAVLLADRAVVLIDGHLETEVDINLARPRHRGTPGFAAIRQLLLAHLGVDADHDSPPDPPGPPDPHQN